MIPSSLLVSTVSNRYTVLNIPGETDVTIESSQTKAAMESHALRKKAVVFKKTLMK